MLNVDPNLKLPFMDALSYGGQMFLIGMVTVFAVLGVIFLCLMIFKFAFSKAGNSVPKKEATVPAPIYQAPVQKTTDAELVAVIAAAIAMAESESGNGAKFRVVSFRRK